MDLHVIRFDKDIQDERMSLIMRATLLAMNVRFPISLSIITPGGTRQITLESMNALPPFCPQLSEKQ